MSGLTVRQTHGNLAAQRRRFFRTMLALSVLLAVVIGAATLFGGSGFLGHVPWGQASEGEIEIFWHVRLPRVLLGALAGMALSAAGVAFQALLRNPLADPYVLGVTGGASLGGILGLALFHLTTPWLSVASFMGALVVMFLIYAISTRSVMARGRLSVQSLLLSGVVFTSFTTALIMFIHTIVDLQQAHELLSWLMGNVSSKSYTSIAWLTLFLAACSAGLFFQSARFNMLSLGEEAAEHLGVPVERTKRLTFVIASVLVGATVAECGMIGFVGLMVPHMVRLMIGSDHRLLLPASILFGGSFLVITDFFARTLFYPAELPVGVLTALLGAPFFVVLLLRSRAV